MPHMIENISHWSSKELKAALADPDHPAVVIDVREPEEYENAHIEGVPLIPMGDIIDVIEHLDPNKEYVFVCRSGRRSLEVAKFFQGNGFERVHNHQGGMLDWQQEGHEIAAGRDNIIEQFSSQQQLERKKNK
jgi:rhodanese-related sulfurtransferase